MTTATASRQSVATINSEMFGDCILKAARSAPKDGHVRLILSGDTGTLIPAGSNLVLSFDLSEPAIHAPLDCWVKVDDLEAAASAIEDQPDAAIRFSGESDPIEVALSEFEGPVARIFPCGRAGGPSPKKKKAAKKARKPARAPKAEAPAITPAFVEAADIEASTPITVSPPAVPAPADGEIPEAEPCVMCGTTKGWSDKKKGVYIRMAGGHCKKCYFNHVRPGAGGEGAPRQPRPSHHRHHGGGWIKLGGRLINPANITNLYFEDGPRPVASVSFVGSRDHLMIEGDYARDLYAILSDGAISGPVIEFPGE